MPEFKLPPRLYKIAEMLKRDRSLKEIAQELGLRDRTVINYVCHLRELSYSDNRAELLEFLKSNEPAIASKRKDKQAKTRDAVIKLRKQNLNLCAIASKLNIHRNTVARHLEHDS